MMTTAHLMAQDVVVEGRWMRQRCAWCGKAIIEEDLTLCMVQVQEGEGQQVVDGVPRWEPNTWVEIDPGCPTVCRRVEPEEGRLPPNACTRDVLPTVRLVSA